MRYTLQRNSCQHIPHCLASCQYAQISRVLTTNLVDSPKRVLFYSVYMPKPPILSEVKGPRFSVILRRSDHTFYTEQNFNEPIQGAKVLQVLVVPFILVPCNCAP